VLKPGGVLSLSTELRLAGPDPGTGLPGRAVRRSTTVLGCLLVITGLAYIINTVANALLSNYDDFEALFLTIVVIRHCVAASTMDARVGSQVWRAASEAIDRGRSRTSHRARAMASDRKRHIASHNQRPAGLPSTMRRASSPRVPIERRPRSSSG
jgi:hypothetical protein